MAVFEDPQVRRDQKEGSFWGKVFTEFNNSSPVKRNKNMLTSKSSALNGNCQKFNAIYKRCICIGSFYGFYLFRFRFELVARIVVVSVVELVEIVVVHLLDIVAGFVEVVEIDVKVVVVHIVVKEIVHV
nr:hypothetical protein [Tanacetum cinerariifolium]